MKQKSLVKNSIFNVIYTVANILFPLLTSAYVSRILLPTGVGKVAYAQNIASYFVTIAALGIPSYGIREVAKVRGEQEKLNKVFTELMIINAASTTVAVVGYIFLVALNSGISDIRLYIACGTAVFFNYINVDWLYQGEEEYVYISCRSIAIKVLAFISLLLLVKTQKDYILYAWISSLATGGNYIFNIVHARKYVAFDFRELKVKRHFTSIAILAVSIFLSGVYSRVDTTMLGVMTDDNQVGFYSNAHKAVNIVISVGTAISAVFLPRLSYCYKSGRKEFGELINRGIQILSFILFPLSVGLFILADDAVSILYGAAFAESAEIVQLFVPLVVISGFGNLLCYQLVLCTGNERHRLPAYIAGALANILLNAILIPSLAGKGAALASICSELIVNAYQFIKMKKMLKYTIDFKAVIQGAFSATVMGGMVYLIDRCLGLPLLIATTLSFIGGCMTYVLVNCLIRNELALNIAGMLKEKFRNGVRD